MSRMSVPEQERRIRALDELRASRGLTASEREEADRLAHRKYMRVWRDSERQREVELEAMAL